MGALFGVLRSSHLLPLLALVCALAADALHAQSSSGDAAAKARFAVTFARFVQWPAGTFAGEGAPLRLCVMHHSAAVGLAFEQHGGEVVAGHPLVVVANPSTPAGCEILFVDESAPRAGSLGAAYGTPMLTLGSVDGFVSRGGMVELANVDDRLRFDVNLKALRQAQLELSSQVLRLARQVRE